MDCRRVGDELGLAPDVVFELELVAILHDIGKLAVPATILDLARPLNSRERVGRALAHDPRRGDPRRDRRPAAPRARTCARPTSAGTARAIPIDCRATRSRSPARIVFTVDSYDAMTNDRPYRRALARDEARSRIAAGAGTAFDPQVVRALGAGTAFDPQVVRGLLDAL